MKTKVISVTEAARNFADCINRTHYQETTFVLIKNGKPVAKIVPAEQPRKGREIAESMGTMRLTPEEGRQWYQEWETARKNLPPLTNKWES